LISISDAKPDELTLAEYSRLESRDQVIVFRMFFDEPGDGRTVYHYLCFGFPLVVENLLNKLQGVTLSAILFRYISVHQNLGIILETVFHVSDVGSEVEFKPLLFFVVNYVNFFHSYH